MFALRAVLRHQGGPRRRTLVRAVFRQRLGKIWGGRRGVGKTRQVRVGLGCDIWQPLGIVQRCLLGRVQRPFFLPPRVSSRLQASRKFFLGGLRELLFPC